MELAGKTVVVTGGASGFGAGIVQAFLGAGARVAVLDLDLDGAQQVIAGQAEAMALRADVSSGAEVEAAISAVLARFGTLDIVVNNAGWTPRNKPMLEVTEDEFDRLLSVNLKSVYLMARAAAPHLPRGGVIVNIGSSAGLRPVPGLTWYAGTKAAVHMLTRSMALELAAQGVRVVGIAPGIGELALLASFMGREDTPENCAIFAAGNPMGRLTRPDDVARACLFLASGAGEYVNGTVLQLDGGRAA